MSQEGGAPPTNTLEENIEQSFATFEEADEVQQVFSIERNYDVWESYVDQIEDTANPDVVDSLKKQLRFLKSGIEQHKAGLFAENARLASTFVSVAETLQSKLVQMIQDHHRYQTSRGTPTIYCAID